MFSLKSWALKKKKGKKNERKASTSAWVTLKVSSYALRCHFRTRQPFEPNERVRTDRGNRSIKDNTVENDFSSSFPFFSPQTFHVQSRKLWNKRSKVYWESATLHSSMSFLEYLEISWMLVLAARLPSKAISREYREEGFPNFTMTWPRKRGLQGNRKIMVPLWRISAAFGPNPMPSESRIVRKSLELGIRSAFSFS